jgi:hypothetical protein
MLIVADESVDAPIVAALRAAGYAVRAIAETSPSAADEIILREAVLDEAVDHP